MEALFYLIPILAQAQSATSSTPIWLVIILGLITSGVITAILNFWFNRKKTSSETEKIDADAADIIQRAAGELILKVQEQAQIERQLVIDQNRELLAEMAQLKIKVARIPELEHMIEDLKLGVEQLTAQLKEHDITPVYQPIRMDIHPPVPNNL